MSLSLSFFKQLHKGFVSCALISVLLATNASWAHQSDLLLVGDSQSFGSLGPRLLKDLRTTHKISTSYYARSGAIADWWLQGTRAGGNWGSWNAPQGEKEIRVDDPLRTPLMDDLLLKHQPKVTVVQLGGNMHFQSDEIVKSTTRELIRKIKAQGSACLWVGPPPGDKRPEPRYSAFYQVLKTEVEAADCEFMDSRIVLTPAPRGGDGIHLDTMINGKNESQKWTRAISERIQKALDKKKNLDPLNLPAADAKHSG